MKRVTKVLCCLTACCIFLCGCWDKVEIDKRCFVSTIGVDIGKDIDKIDKLKEIKSDDPFPERQIKKYRIVYGYPDMTQLGPGKPGTAETKTISMDSYSLEDAKSKASMKSSRSINLGHSKLLLLSNEIMNYPDIVKEIMDYFERDPFLNRMMNVVITDGKAEDFVKFKPDMENNIEYYITGLMENTKRNAAIFPMTVNEMLMLLTENGNALIPKIYIDKEENSLELKGVAMIKDYKVIGDLTPIETADLAIIRGKVKGGSKVIYKDGHPIDYLIDNVERKIELTRDEQSRLVFNIDIFMESQIKGYVLEEKVLEKDKILEIEEDINKSLSEECTKVANIIQEEFGVDPLGLQEYVEKYKPALWQEVGKDWEKVFKESKIKVNVYAKIRRIGVKE